MNIRSTLLAAGIALALSTTGLNAATLHIHNGGDPNSLDPHKVSGDWENRIVGDMFEGLMTEDKHGKAIPGMAESYTASDDGLVYTFKLRDAKWSDGSAVTAGDFVYAFQRIMDPASAAKYAWLQYPIKNAEAINKGEITDLNQIGVNALDDKTLEITLEQPTPFFIQALTHYTAYPIPKSAVETHGEEWVKPENILVNGPYKPTEWVPGSHVKAVVNDQWYDTGSLKIDEVMYYVLEDESTALKRFEAGEFDIVTEFPTDQIERLRSEMPDTLYVAPMAGLYYYVFNQNNETLKDKRVRQALSMAINREVIADSIVGAGEIPAYSWVPPGMDNYGEPYSVSWAGLDYGEKVAQAKALMADAGVDSLDLELRYNTNENHKRVAVAVAAMWKELGINVELVNTEVKVHYDDLTENDFNHIGRAGWLADYNDPTNLLDLLKSDSNYNYGRWANEEYDAILDEAAGNTDLDARAATLVKAEEIAMEDAAAIPIYYYVTRNLVSTKVSGFENNVFDIHRTRWIEKSE